MLEIAGGILIAAAVVFVLVLFLVNPEAVAAVVGGLISLASAIFVVGWFVTHI